jgi:hypothetical protein
VVDVPVRIEDHDRLEHELGNNRKDLFPFGTGIDNDDDFGILGT